MSTLNRAILSIFVLLNVVSASGQLAVPLNVQGRVTVDGLVFNGIGKFKFALINSGRGSALWTHDNTSSGANFEPTTSIDLNVVRGLYSVLLGDTTVPGMTQPIHSDIFTNADVRLRIWFDDGTHGFQRLNPDQRLAAVGYARNSDRSEKAAVLTGTVTIQQVPAILVTNNATAINLTGAFTGDGSGLVGIRGSTPWQIASAASTDAFPNTGYLVTNRTETVIVLPVTASMRVGDITRVAGPNPGSWRIAQRDGQSIFAGHFRGGIGAQWVARDILRRWTGICSSEDGTKLAAVVYTNGPIMLSTNSGVNWFRPVLPPTRNWIAIACSADASRFIAAADGDRIFISEDSGETWTSRASAGVGAWTSVTSSANGSNLVAVAASGPLVLSADGGATWTAPATAGVRNWASVASSRDGTYIIAAVNGERLYISKDRGATWTGLGAGSRSWTAVASSADGMKLVAAADNDFIYTSADRGTNWVTRDDVGRSPWAALASSADGNKLAAATAGQTSGSILTSIDAGATWKNRLNAPPFFAITSSADGSKLAATTFGGNIYTSDSPTVQFTTPGPNGYLLGDQYSAVELQHLGEGKFFPLSSSGTIFAY